MNRKRSFLLLMFSTSLFLAISACRIEVRPSFPTPTAIQQMPYREPTVVTAMPGPTQTTRIVVTATPQRQLASPSGVVDTIYALCKCRWQRTPLTSKTYLSWAWVAATAVLARDFIDASTVSVFLDGRSLGIFNNRWGAVEYKNWVDFGNGYGAVWSYPIIEIPNLKPGLHRFEIRVDLSKQVTDGFDSNNDGKPDQFGPGMAEGGWVEVELY